MEPEIQAETDILLIQSPTSLFLHNCPSHSDAYIRLISSWSRHLAIHCASPDLATWHRRLGHINYTSIIRMAKKSLATGMLVNLSTLPPICEHCVATKQMK